MFGFGIHNGSDDEMQGADRGPTAWLTGYNSCDKSNPAEGAAAARLAAKEFAAPAKAYDTNSGGDKTEFGDLIANGVDFDQGVKKGVVQTGNYLAVSGRKMMLLFLFSMIGSVSADACSTPCASGTCGSLNEYLSCFDFTELNCDCTGCCSMPPPSMPPPLQHHAPSAPPIKKAKVAAALGLTAMAGKKIMDKVPDELTCSASDVPLCEEIEELKAENDELKAENDELKLKVESLENDVAALKLFVGMMPPAAPLPPNPPNPPSTPLAFYDEFPGAEESWDGTSNVTCCGSLGCMLGGYEVLGSGAAVEKTFETLAAHTQLRVIFNFIKIDSWDYEHAYLYIDDELAWQSDALYPSEGDQICGRSTSAASADFNDKLIPVDVTVVHISNTATLRVTTNLNSPATDESWGIQDVHVLLIV